MRYLIVISVFLVVTNCLSAQSATSSTVYVTDIAWNSNYTRMAAVGVYPGTASAADLADATTNSFGYISVLDVSTGQTVFTATPPSAFTSVVWSPDNTRLALGSFDGTVWIVDANTGETMANLVGHQATVTDVDWNSDGTVILSSGNWDGLVIAWNGLSYVPMIKLMFPDSIFSLDISPDGTLVTVSTDASVYLYPITMTDSNLLFSNYRILDGQFQTATFSSSGDYVIIGSFARESILTGERSNSQIYLVDTVTRAPLFQFDSGRLSVRGMSWNADGREIAIVYESNILQVVDPFTGEVQAEFSTNGAERYTIGIEFSEFGGQLAYSTSFDGNQLLLGSEVSRTQSMPFPIQFVVPIATAERFTEIAAFCNAPASLTTASGDTSLQAQSEVAQGQLLLAQLDALPEDTILPGCEADLRAIAETMGSE